MASSDADDLITRVDKAIGRYYSSMGADNYFDASGKGKFAQWCGDNGFEDEGVCEEIEESPTNCMLVDFAKDDDGSLAFFPGLAGDIAEEDRQVLIFNIIKTCIHAPDTDFAAQQRG